MRIITGTGVAVAVACALTASLAGQSADFSPERVKAHVTFLADDLLEGREPGTRGHELAARYIASQFAQLGIKPGAKGNSYYQPVELVESAPVGTPTFTLNGARGSTSFRHGTEVVVLGPSRGGTAQTSGEVVFVGFGVSDSVLGIDDYKGLDVRGRFVVVLSAPMSGIDSEIAAHLQSEQRRTAAAHGALGVFSIQTRSGARVRPFSEVLKRANRPATTWVSTNRPAVPQGDAFLGPKAAARLFEGSGTTLEQVLDEADKPGARVAGRALAVRAELRVTTAARRYTSPDVVGLIEGSDPLLKQEYVVLMGHADHLGVDPQPGADRIYNGALDNAAGVATLLEVARAFAVSPQRPKRSILIVANTAEEKGLLGAEAFANDPPVPADRIVAAIDLDMPLLLYDFTDVVAYGGSHSTVDVAFRTAGREMGIALSPDPMPEQTIFVRSDHYAMAKVGVPAVMLATGMANGGDKAWERFLSTQYHQQNDDLQLPINWNAGAKFAELNYRALRLLADANEPARWYEGDYFGNLFAPSAKKAAR